jgi:hypothetical protein
LREPSGADRGSDGTNRIPFASEEDVRRVARTIADLEGVADIAAAHVAGAVHATSIGRWGCDAVTSRQREEDRSTPAPAGKIRAGVKSGVK